MGGHRSLWEANLLLLALTLAAKMGARMPYLTVLLTPIMHLHQGAIMGLRQ